MKKSVLQSLSEKDTVLLLETKGKNLDVLDEDGLAELHQRVQRVRGKHVKNYRRAGAARVEKTGTRGGAGRTNQRHRDRAEVWEDALARVSRRLAAAARASAAQLRAERLAAAGKHRAAPPPLAGQSPGQPATPADRLDDRRVFTPARKKRVASSAAAGNRRQARKDNR